MGGKGIGMAIVFTYMYCISINVLYGGRVITYTASFNYFFYLLGYVQEDDFSSHGFILQQIIFAEI